MNFNSGNFLVERVIIGSPSSDPKDTRKFG